MSCMICLKMTCMCVCFPLVILFIIFRGTAMQCLLPYLKGLWGFVSKCKCDQCAAAGGQCFGALKMFCSAETCSTLGGFCTKFGS